MKNDEIVNKIVSYLEEKTGRILPENTVIAGQSVAEAYFRVMNIPIHTRIKDIDIFGYTNKFENLYFENDKERKFSIVNQGNNVFFQSDSSFGMVSTVYNSKIVILNVKDDGLFNYIKTEPCGSALLSNYTYLHHVVDSFDINSVQIGIDLTTRKIYTTEAFLEFVKTKQLEITNHCSPIPSVARIIEKHKQSPETYLNIDYEIQLAIMKIFLTTQKISQETLYRGVFMSLKRFQGFSSFTKNKIYEYFNIEYKEAKCHYQKRTHDNDNDIFDEETIFFDDSTENFYFELVKFTPKLEKIPEDLFNKLTLIRDRFSYTSMFRYINRDFLINLLKKDFHSKVLTRTDKTLKSLMLYYFDSELFEKNKNDVLIASKHHLFSLVFMTKYKHTISDIANFIRKVEKSNQNHIIGLYETGVLKGDIISEDFEDILKFIKERNEQLSKEYKYHVNFDFTKKFNIPIFQITNQYDLTLLGNEMKHCVGGYWHSVLEGQSLIFDIQKSKAVDERWTVEFRLYKDYYRDEDDDMFDEFFDDDIPELLSKKPSESDNLKYIVSQVYGHKNNSAPYSIKSICDKMVKIINEELKDKIK